MPSPGQRVSPRSFAELPAWLVVLVIAALLVGCWALVYGTGGTRTAFPHVFYVPIVLAALPFGLWGGIGAAVLAMLLCGPAMPLDVAAGESQQVLNWVIRGGFFLTVGGVAGTSTQALRRSFRSHLENRLQQELDLAEPAAAPSDGQAWELRIRQTLDRETFRPVFQPIYRLDDGRLLAVEALTRFESEPAFTPDVWFNQAARLGLAIELELATIKAALEASRDLPDDVALTFNASPELLTSPQLLHLLDWHPDRRLVAEVTEHVIIDDYAALKGCLDTLRERGIALAVDDAGAGFASLRHIVRLQPDFIKLDPTLTQNLRHDPVRRPLADALLQFADRTGSHIVVEGIETGADLSTWQEMGAYAAQGYLLARPGPLPVDAQHELLAGRPNPTVGRVVATPSLFR